MDPLNTARWFREKQEHLGLSNQQMADALGVSVTHVENMRSGRRNVTRPTRILMEMLRVRNILDHIETNK